MLFAAGMQEIETDPRCSEDLGQPEFDRPGAIRN